MNDDLKLRANFHTHTARCKHASATPEDYCVQAEKNGMKLLGFSDHGPFADNLFFNSRMDFKELPEYIADVRTAAQNHPNLKVLCGLEIEYRPELGSGYYRDELLGTFQLDYLLGATHFVFMPDGSVHPFYKTHRETTAVLNQFVRHTVETMEHLPILYMAHPDCMGHVAGRITPELKSGFRDIVAAAADLGIPLEINANGFRKGLFETEGEIRYRYPLDAFWEIVAETRGVRTVIGMDAHSPELVSDGMDVCLDYAKRFGLTPCNDELAKQFF